METKKEFNFEELKSEISFKLYYPSWVLSTRQDAAQKLQISVYMFDKLRKKYPYFGCYSHGSIFYYNSDLRRILGEDHPESRMDPDFDELEKNIGYVLVYPRDKLLVLKTAPGFLGISKYAFNKMRKNGQVREYEHIGFKFFNIKELALLKGRPSLK